MRFRTALAAASLVLAATFMPISATAEARDDAYFSNAEVVDQNGTRLRFYDDVLKDQIVVISFIYTSCGDICPLSTARLAVVRDKLKALGRTDIRFISMTVDPETDTPEKLKAFADGMNAGEGWMFITGKPAVIKAINSKLGDRSKRPSDHRMEIVVGNAATDEWARNSPLGELDRLVFDILQFDPNWRETKRSVAHDNDANVVRDLSEQPGEGLYRKLCSACHTIGVGNRVGPDLRDVTERRSHKWLKAYIMAPDKLLRKGDVIAVELDAAFPHAVMPTLGLQGGDTEDLISYLKATDASLTDGEDHAGAHIHEHADGSKHNHAN